MQEGELRNNLNRWDWRTKATLRSLLPWVFWEGAFRIRVVCNVLAVSAWGEDWSYGIWYSGKPACWREHLVRLAGVVGLCPNMHSKGSQYKHEMLLLWSSLGLIDSSRHRHGMSVCQQPVESCSDVANPLGNRAMAGSQCLMTQLSPGVVIAVEEVVLFFKSFVQPMDQLDGILPRPVVRRNYNTKIFWGWANRDCRFCVGADGPGGFSFAIRKFTSSSKYSLIGYCSAQQLEPLSLPAHPHEQDRARTPSSFSPPADLPCAFLTRRPDPQSSHLPVSVPQSYQELMASSSLLSVRVFMLRHG